MSLAKKCASWTSDSVLWGLRLWNEQNEPCMFSTLALMNVKYGAFLAAWAKYWNTASAPLLTCSQLQSRGQFLLVDHLQNAHKILPQHIIHNFPVATLGASPPTRWSRDPLRVSRFVRHGGAVGKIEQLLHVYVLRCKKKKSGDF